MHQSAMCANDDQTFWPLTTKWPFSRPRARAHRRRGRSPAPGSEKPWHQISSVERIFSRCFCFWASVPCAMIVGPAMPRPITPRCGGASARAISSRKIAWWLYGAPRAAVLLRPGQPGVAGLVQLPAPVASGLLEAPRRTSSVRFVSIHARSSARNAASSGVSRRSMERLYPVGNRATIASASAEHAELRHVGGEPALLEPCHLGVANQRAQGRVHARSQQDSPSGTPSP